MHEFLRGLRMHVKHYLDIITVRLSSFCGKNESAPRRCVRLALEHRAAFICAGQIGLFSQGVCISRGPSIDSCVAFALSGGTCLTGDARATRTACSGVVSATAKNNERTRVGTPHCLQLGQRCFAVMRPTRSISRARDARFYCWERSCKATLAKS